MKKKIPLFLCWKGFLITLLLATSMIGHAESGYVGETLYVTIPNHPGATIASINWSSTASYLTLTNRASRTCMVKIKNYFTGTARVTCSYILRTGTGVNQKQIRKEYSVLISCNPVYLNIHNPNISLNVGDQERILYTSSPVISPSPVVQFTSSNPNVASVSSSGYVTAKKPGEATITLSNSAGPSAQCKVKVLDVDPTSVSIPSSLTVYVGETEPLSASLYPSNATATLTWYSQNKNVATVSSGRVTGVDEGSTVVYVKTNNGLTSNDCKVNVYYRKATSISLDNTSFILPVGDSKKLKYSFAPSHARVSVRWTSSNPSVVSVSNDGTLTALKTGDASITATTDNGLTAKCKVKVLPLPTQLALPETLIIDWSDSYKLAVQSYPSESYLDLEWTSSDESVVTVSANGEVKGIETGCATVTVTASNGVTASCDVEVTVPKCILNLWLHDGSCFAYPFSEHPIIQADKKVTFVKTQKESIEYNTADVRKYTLSKVEPVVGEYSEITSIENLQVNAPRLRIEQDCIVLSQCGPDMPIGVYFVSGQLIGTYRTDSNGYLAIPISNLSKGIYIIKSRSITYKIARK